MKTTHPIVVYTVFTVMVMFLGVFPIEGVDIDPDGRMTNFRISFSSEEYPDEADEQAFYCAVVQTFNQFIWQATNGQHWLAEVDFVQDDWSADVEWRRSDGRAFAGGVITMYDEVDAATGFVQPAANLGWILLHEFGHYFYELDDEYCDSNYCSGGGGMCPDGRRFSTGICVNFDYVPCVPPEIPTGITSCVMAKRYLAHWCDTTNHLEVNEDFPELSNPAAIGYTCWDRARQWQVDLTHVEGEYLEVGDAPETVTCNFNASGAGFVNDAVLVLDRSGSMDYEGLPGIPAIRLASDAALVFYNKTAMGQYSGVLGFNHEVADPWPIPYGAFAGEVFSLEIEATGATNIADAIDAAAEAIVNQGNNGNRKIVLISDGKHNTGPSPIEAAARANGNDIEVYTLAFGDADRDLLQDIADAGGGRAWVAGAGSPSPDEPNAHELKEDIARARFKVEGKLEVFERLGPIQPDAGQVVESFHVPTGASRLDFAWLGNRFCGDPIVPALSLAVQCDCSFERLHLEIQSPSGAVYLPAAVDATVDGEYRTVQVPNPEPGNWIARLDSSNTTCAVEDPIEVAWTGFIRHTAVGAQVWTDSPRAPLDHPVVIHALMRNGSIVTNIFAEATVRHLGSESVVAMNDGGEGDDARAGDGIYTGTFNHGGQLLQAGAYQIRVRMEADGATARPADAGILPDDQTLLPWSAPAPRTARLLTEGMFRLSGRYSLDAEGKIGTGSATASLPGLMQGQCYSNLELSVQGIPMIGGQLRLGLGEGVEVENIRVLDLYPEEEGKVTFDACVEPCAAPGSRTVAIQFRDEIVRDPAATATITCKPQEPPAVSVTPEILWPPNHKMRDVVVTLPPVECLGSRSLTATISSSEQDDAIGKGDGKTSGDTHGGDGFASPVMVALGENGGVLHLRAERGGRGSGRTYIIRVSSTDACGNSTSSEVTVRVPHDRNAG